MSDQLQQSDDSVPLELDCPRDHKAQKVCDFLGCAIRLVNVKVPFALTLVNTDKKLVEHLN